MLLAAENPRTRGNICPCVTLSTTNPSQIGVEFIRPRSASTEYFYSHHSPNLMPYSFRYSQCNKIVSGVPQGSVLGPLMFLVYVNDIWRNIDSSIRLFADECIMYRKITNKNDIVNLQKNL
jgi:hypothetical protein